MTTVRQLHRDRKPARDFVLDESPLGYAECAHPVPVLFQLPDSGDGTGYWHFPAPCKSCLPCLEHRRALALYRIEFALPLWGRPAWRYHVTARTARKLIEHADRRGDTWVRVPLKKRGWCALFMTSAVRGYAVAHLDLSPAGMRELVATLERQMTLEPVTGSDFWHGRRPPREARFRQAACTRAHLERTVARWNERYRERGQRLISTWTGRSGGKGLRIPGHLDANPVGHFLLLQELKSRKLRK